MDSIINIIEISYKCYKETKIMHKITYIVIPQKQPLEITNRL